MRSGPGAGSIRRSDLDGLRCGVPLSWRIFSSDQGRSYQRRGHCRPRPRAYSRRAACGQPWLIRRSLQLNTSLKKTTPEASVCEGGQSIKEMPEQDRQNDAAARARKKRIARAVGLLIRLRAGSLLVLVLVAVIQTGCLSPIDPESRPSDAKQEVRTMIVDRTENERVFFALHRR